MANIFRLSHKEIREDLLSTRFIRLAIVVVSIIPLLYGVLYLWAFWDPYSRLENMPVAVVNEDVGYSEDGTSANFGNELMNNLKSNQVLKWDFVNQKDAEEGLQNHKYFAEIKIPADFSQNIESVSTSNPQKAKIEFIARESNSMIGAQLSNRVASQISSNLSNEITKNYIDNIFLQSRKSVEGVQKAADGTHQLSTGLENISNGSNKLSAGSTAAYNGSNSLLIALNQMLLGGQNLSSGISQSYAGAQTLNTGVGGAANGAKNLASGSTSLKSGITQVNTGVNQLLNNYSGTITNLATVQSYLADPSTTITDPSSLFYGMTKLQASNYIVASIVAEAQKPSSKTQISSLQNGLAQVQSGSDSLDSGISSLSSALNEQIYPGSTSLVQGLDKINTGASSLNQGISATYNGTGSLVSGLQQVASGSKSLDSGISSAKTGAEELGKQLSSGAQDALQKNNVALTEKLSPVMSDPVVLNDESINKVANYGTGFSPYFIPLALWVGSLILFLVIKVNDKTLGSLKPRDYFAAKYIALAKIGTLQAVILDLVLILALGLRPLNYYAFFAFTILISWCFLAILEFLVATLQDGGKFIGIVLLMLQLTSASGTYPVQTSPAFFQTISSFLPMTYAVKGLREIISGGNTRNIKIAFIFIAMFAISFLAILLINSKRIMKSKVNLAV